MVPCRGGCEACSQEDLATECCHQARPGQVITCQPAACFSCSLIIQQHCLHCICRHDKQCAQQGFCKHRHLVGLQEILDVYDCRQISNISNPSNNHACNRNALEKFVCNTTPDVASSKFVLLCYLLKHLLSLLRTWVSQTPVLCTSGGAKTLQSLLQVPKQATVTTDVFIGCTCCIEASQVY